MNPTFVLKNIAYFVAMKRMKRLKKKSLHRRQKIYNVATLSFKESVLTVAQDRSDDVSKAVIN